ncbi:MAG: choice-of-anchor L domain-containing protein [Bacteroidales bacterium]|nr:choice-of-anchor L domain-containing protein [Bacteroidales bacterium]
MVQILVGPGVEFSDVTYTGVTIASGSFGGLSNIGFDNGIILTSGKASISAGPNSSSSAGFENFAAGDSDLAAISGVTSHDACVLEFNFIPQSSIVEFEYVFASEEYHEYANSTVNDAFGFFISGPGISGPYSNSSKNIALIPLTSPPTPVSINTVNNGTSNNGPCEYCNYLLHNSEQSIQYDAFTIDTIFGIHTTLVARASVTPCERYHIKLAVGDGGDGIYDSGVFLGANSFTSVGIAGSCAFGSQYIDSIAVEDCNDALLTFELDNHATEDFFIPIEIFGTATNGIDYDTIPDTLMIPQGYRIVEIPVIAFYDEIPEGFETVKIRYNTSLCEPNYDTIIFEIYDKPEYDMIAREDTIVHCEDSVQLYTIEAGGMPPYFYQWIINDTVIIDTTANPFITMMNPTDFLVKQWDACGDTLVDSVFVDVIGPTAGVSVDTSICLYDTATLTGYGGSSYEWSTGDTTQTILVSPEEETTYIVIVFDACGNQDADTVTVFVASPQANAGEDVTICLNNSTDLTAGGGLYYEWNTGQTTQTINVSPLVDTEYWVFVTDACNNTAVDSVWVFVNDEVVANAGPDQTICFGDTTTLSASGGVEYEWNTGETTPNIDVSPEVTTVYIIEVFDGCYDTDSVTVFVDPLPDVEATSASSIICFEDTIQLYASGADEYYWTSDPVDPTLSGQETSPNPLVTPLQNTIYTLQGTDLSTTCENTSSVLVAVRDQLMSTFDLTAESACENEPVYINYSGNATSGATYDWDFDNGNSTGSGQGPINVYWSSLGEKIISLKVFENGCESYVTYDTVQVNPTPMADFDVSEISGCVPFTIDFINNSSNLIPETEYLWDFGNGDNSNQQQGIYTYNEAGTYDLSLTVFNGNCDDTKTVNSFIQANPNPVADFTVTPTLTSIENSTISFNDNSSIDAVSWIWDLADGNFAYDENFTHTYSDTGTFVIQLISENIFGCTDTAYKQVMIKPHPRIYMPNAFVPNSIGENKTFDMIGIGIEEVSMSIFNRWGERIFYTNRLGEGWDGKINGNDAPMGTYIYYVTYKNNLGQSDELYGTVTLIR